MRRSFCNNWKARWFAGLLILMIASSGHTQEPVAEPVVLVNPLIGTTNGGNDYPGATLPLGMLAWSPEEPRSRQQVARGDDPGRPAAPDGYEYNSDRIRGFSLTHLMGVGCASASGDIPFMPYTGGDYLLTGRRHSCRALRKRVFPRRRDCAGGLLQGQAAEWRHNRTHYDAAHWVRTLHLSCRQTCHHAYPHRSL